MKDILLTAGSKSQTAIEALDDDALFGNEEDEEEDGAFVMYVVFETLISHLVTDYQTLAGAILRMHWATISWVFESWVLLPSLGCRA